jgi:chromosome segregation ATPase
MTIHRSTLERRIEELERQAQQYQAEFLRQQDELKARAARIAMLEELLRDRQSRIDDLRLMMVNCALRNRDFRRELIALREGRKETV